MEGDLEKTLKICEIYKSIGLYSNMPTVFIRTSGCNLRCSWCDTKYAYDEGSDLSIKFILNYIEKSTCRYICITGGEPLFQDNINILIYRLICLLRIFYPEHDDCCITIETNGVFNVNDIICGAESLLRKDFNIFKFDNFLNFIIDYKLPSSSCYGSFNSENFEVANDAPKGLITFKFVISTERDYEIAKEICLEKNYKDISFCDRQTILFSPVCDGEISKEKLAEKIIEDNLNVRYLLSLNKSLWGEKRGV